jgi:hypothetical protein
VRVTPVSLVDGLVDLVTFELLEQVARTGSLTAAATGMGHLAAGLLHATRARCPLTEVAGDV